MNTTTKKLNIFKVVLIVFSVALLFICVSLCFVFPRRHTEYVNQYANKYNVDSSLVYAVIRCESNYDEKAVSRVGAIGLMQLMPSTAMWCAGRIGVAYSEEKLYDEEYNIMIGVYYLSYLQEKFNYVDTITAYNAGEGNVIKWASLGYDYIPFKETREYVKKVMIVDNIYNAFKGL